MADDVGAATELPPLLASAVVSRREGAAASLALEAWAAEMSQASSDPGVVLPLASDAALAGFALVDADDDDDLPFFPDPAAPPPAFLFLPGEGSPPPPLAFGVPVASLGDFSTSRRSFDSFCLAARCGLWTAFHSAKRTSYGFDRPGTSRFAPTECDLHVSAREQGTPLALMTPQCRFRSSGASAETMEESRRQGE